MNKPESVKPKTPGMEMRPLATIKPYWRNPRKNDAAVPAAKQSILRYGMLQPLVLDKDGVIIVGHTRYRALVEMGAEDAPVIIADHLSQKKAREYRIADNKVAEFAEWDRNALVPELRATDLEAMGLFFREADLSKLLGEAGQNFRPVSAEEMDRAINRQQQGFAGLTKAPTGAYILLTCPHCGDDFEVERNAMLNHPGEKKDGD